MRHIAITIAITLSACRVVPDDTPAGTPDCIYTVDCAVGEVCAVGHCHDIGCDYGVEVCCTDTVWGSICVGETWSPPSTGGSGFTPTTGPWTHEHNGMTADEAWLEVYASNECAVRVCR